MKSLVTGGAGFIGSHLVDYLLEKGAEVTIVDNLSTGSGDNINTGARFIEDDINNENFSSYLQGCDFVFHVAALPRISPSFDQRFEHHVANIDGTLNVIEACMRQGVKKIVYSGSSAVYGQPEETPTPESCLIAPLNPYSLQKFTAEQYGLLIGRHIGLPFVSLRYFNPYGPRSYNPENEYSAYSSVIGIFQHRVANGEPLDVTGDGSQLRDFIHVRDLAHANVCAAMSETDFGIFNVGFGKARAVIEIANMLSSKINFIHPRAGEASITLADISLAREHLSWEPTIDVVDYLKEWLQNSLISE